MKSFLLNNFYYLKFNKNKLFTIFVKEILSNFILMIAFSTFLNLHLIIFNLNLIFFSRKKKITWLKGNFSKNFQYIKYIYIDCDMDCLILEILQIYNITCHLNLNNCFLKL